MPHCNGSRFVKKEDMLCDVRRKFTIRVSEIGTLSCNLVGLIMMKNILLIFNELPFLYSVT